MSSGIPNIGQGDVYTDASGRLFRVVVEYIDKNPKISLPVIAAPEVVVRPPAEVRPDTVVTAHTQPATPGLATAYAAPPSPARSQPPTFTAFVLAYGDYPEMHRRCLSALVRTTSPADVELRVIQNAVSPTSRLVIDSAIAGRADRVYRWDENRHKYPIMRQVFRDPEAPIRTPWVLWFDDDSMCDVNPNWVSDLKKKIAAAMAADPKTGMVGAKFFFSLTRSNVDWLRAAPWHRGLPTRDRFGRPAPNGDKVHFVTGGFWAMRTYLINDADIPDGRLQHNGGDVCIGEQVYQAGYSLVHWNHDKRQVVTSSAPRRGTNQGKLNWV